MLKELRNSNDGVVFVAVLIIIIVSMVLAMSVLSLNISQVKSAEDEVKSIQATILAEGGLAQILMNQWSDTAGDTTDFFITHDGTRYNITADIGAIPPGSTVAPLIIDVDF